MKIAFPHPVDRRYFLKSCAAVLGGSAWSVSKGTANSAPDLPAATRANEIRLYPDWFSRSESFRHSWEGIVNVDQFHWLVRADVQSHLKMARQELGAEYVRAVGQFDDELRVLGFDPRDWNRPDRQPRSNWQILDYVFDSLHSLGLKPIFMTAFMPGALAATPTTGFNAQARISLPKDMAVWGRFVNNAVRHVVQRYGLDLVRSWYFEVWNEPNRAEFFEGTQADFFRLWAATYRAIKDVDSKLRVGGPSTAQGAWLRDLIEYGRRYHCEPDYLTCHGFENHPDGIGLAAAPSDEVAPDSAQNLGDLVRCRRHLLEELDFKGELHWNVWGRSSHPCDDYRETPYEAAWIVKTMAEASQDATHFAYWCLTDVYDRAGYGAEAFHGNCGLVNLQQLRKPAYHAFVLLRRLGQDRLSLQGQNLAPGTNAIATRTSQGYQVLVYSVPSNPEASPRSIEVCLFFPWSANAATGSLILVDHQHYDVRKTWENLGQPAYPTPDQKKVLAARNKLAPVRLAPHMHQIGHQRLLRFNMQSPGLAYYQVSRY